MFAKNFLNHLARKENIPVTFLQKQFAAGRLVIPNNKRRSIQNPCAIGEGTRIKINTNIGLSTGTGSVRTELEKLTAAVELGADTVMDLSVSDNLAAFRHSALAASSVPLGTVPIYEAALAAFKRTGSFEKMSFEDIWDVLKTQAEDGVDFFTIHAGILKKFVHSLHRKKRTGGIVSRGGALMARWMLRNKKENILFDRFDDILSLAKTYNITLSLGDALRPGAIADSTDRLQLAELRILGELIRRCRKKGVQAMVEGPGHIRIDEIPMNVRLEKKLCHNAPFYVLGPLPTDIAAGYDHISSAIGGALAGLHGADFLCVVTPAEHLRHPNLQDIRDGTIASKIAAHCVNLLHFKDEWARDRALSLLRARRKWEAMFPFTINQKKARHYRRNLKSSDDLCSMCGDFCSLKIAESCDLIK